MNAQARGEFAQADADLNKTYQAVLAKLSTADGAEISFAVNANADRAGLHVALSDDEDGRSFIADEEEELPEVALTLNDSVG